MRKIYLSLASVLCLGIGFSQVNPYKAKPVNANNTSSQHNIPLGSNPHMLTNSGANVAQINNNSSSVNHSCKSHELTQQHYQDQGVWDQFQLDYLNAAAQMQNYVQNKTTGPVNISNEIHVVQK